MLWEWQLLQLIPAAEMQGQPRCRAPVVLHKCRPLARLPTHVLLAEALRIRPEAEIMHGRRNRRAGAIGIRIHTEGVIRNPVDQTSRMSAGRPAVVIERSFGIGERSGLVTKPGGVTAQLEEMPAPHPRQHIRHLCAAFVRIGALPQRRRSPEEKAVWPNGDLWRRASRSDVGL